MRHTRAAIAIAVGLAGIAVAGVMAVTSSDKPRTADSELTYDIQHQVWVWDAPRTPGGHPLALYRWQVWTVESNVLLREETSGIPRAEVNFNRLELGGQHVYIRVWWVSTKGRVTMIGDSPHLLIEPVPVPIEEPPFEEPPFEPDPFAFDSTGIVSMTHDMEREGVPHPKVTLTYIGARVELCRVAYYDHEARPFPDLVEWEVVGANPPIRAVGPSERGQHCHWFEATIPEVDLGMLGIRPGGSA